MFSSLHNLPLLYPYAFSRKANIGIGLKVVFIASFVGSFLSSKPFLSIAFSTVLTFSLWSAERAEMSLSTLVIRRSLIALSLANAAICMVQIFNPSFIIVSHLYQDYAIQGGSSFGLVIPFWPSFGRLSGLFVENGPMVISLMIANHFLILSTVSKNRASPSDPGLYSMLGLACVFINILFILFTGSKYALVFPLVFLLPHVFSVFSKASALIRLKFQGVARRLRILLIIIFVFAACLLLFYLQAKNCNLPFCYELKNFQSLENRLAMPELPLLFGNGMGGTTTGDIPSLNAFAIYTYAFGIIPGLGFLIGIYLFMLSPRFDPVLTLLLTLSLLGSGSVLMYHYSVIIIISRKASRLCQG